MFLLIKKLVGISMMFMFRFSLVSVYRRRGSLIKSLEEEVWVKIVLERGILRESVDFDNELNIERLLRIFDDIMRDVDD